MHSLVLRHEFGVLLLHALDHLVLVHRRPIERIDQQITLRPRPPHLPPAFFLLLLCLCGEPYAPSSSASSLFGLSISPAHENSTLPPQMWQREIFFDATSYSVPSPISAWIVTSPGLIFSSRLFPLSCSSMVIFMRSAYTSSCTPQAFSCTLPIFGKIEQRPGLALEPIAVGPLPCLEEHGAVGSASGDVLWTHLRDRVVDALHFRLHLISPLELGQYKVSVRCLAQVAVVIEVEPPLLHDPVRLVAADKGLSDRPQVVATLDDPSALVRKKLGAQLVRHVRPAIVPAVAVLLALVGCLEHPRQRGESLALIHRCRDDLLHLRSCDSALLKHRGHRVHLGRVNARLAEELRQRGQSGADVARALVRHVLDVAHEALPVICFWLWFSSRKSRASGLAPLASMRAASRTTFEPLPSSLRLFARASWPISFHFADSHDSVRCSAWKADSQKRSLSACARISSGVCFLSMALTAAASFTCTS